MGTKKEQTLQIKDFKGVNRFNDGTVTPPNEFYTLQNYHPVNRAEIATVGGVVDQMTGNSLPGVSSIMHTAFLEQSFGEKFHVLFYKPNIDVVAAPTFTAANLSTSGGTSTNHSVQITYVGPGGATNSTILTSVAIQANGLTYTPPIDVPDYVAEIDIYIFHVNTVSSITDQSDAGMLCGSMHRRNGVFAASITCPKPVKAITTNTVPDVQPTTFGFTATTGGTLLSGVTYYMAIAPFVAQQFGYTSPATSKDTRAYLTTTVSAVSFMTFQLPVGYNAVTVRWGFGATPAVAAGTNVTRWCIFIGTTPEDMLAVCDTTDGTITSITDTQARSVTAGTGITIKENPYNSRLGIWMEGTGARGNFLANISAISGRNYGHYRGLMIAAASYYFLDYQSGVAPDFNNDFTVGHDATYINKTGGLPIIGAWATKTLPWSATTAYQLLPHCSERFLSLTGLQRVKNGEIYNQYTVPSFNFLWQDSSTEVYTSQNGNRLYGSNNDNSTWYTNGYVIRQIMGDSGSSNVPITKYIDNTKDRLCLAGGPDSFSNTSHQVFYSETNNPFNYGTAPVWNNFRVWSKEEINGLGIFSQDLDASGPNSFLIISKKDTLFTWNALTGSSQVVTELSYKTGFAGPRAFGRTKLGPVFVGRDNVYVFKSGDSILPFGYEFKDVINNLTETQRNLVSAVYHDDKLKIGYPSSGTDLDREIWLELRLEDSEIQKYYSGPHTLLPFTSQAVANSFNSTSNVRLSAYNGMIYQRDSGTLNNGASIPHNIVINRLGLQQDHFLKVLTRIYMALKITQNENFTFTMDQEDGTGQTVLTSQALFTTAARQLLQTHVVNRVLGRVNSLTISNTSSAAHSIYDISMLFNILRRRQLR